MILTLSQNFFNDPDIQDLNKQYLGFFLEILDENYPNFFGEDFDHKNYDLKITNVDISIKKKHFSNNESETEKLMKNENIYSSDLINQEAKYSDNFIENSFESKNVINSNLQKKSDDQKDYNKQIAKFTENTNYNKVDYNDVQNSMKIDQSKPDKANVFFSQEKNSFMFAVDDKNIIELKINLFKI